MDDLVLYPVPSIYVDRAWKDGASTLVDACESECTIDQLKMLCLRGERQLVRMDRTGKTVGWGVFKVENFPNFRALHITNMVARNAHFEQFFEALKKLSSDLGCSRIRCSAKPLQQRIYEMKCGFKPVYTTLEIEV